MTMKTIRLGVVGCGRVTQHYRKILDSGVVTGFSVAGVCDLKPEAAAPLAAHWGCPSYGTLDALLDGAKPDLVLVLTPSGHHHAHARRALERGFHVLVEKPLAMRPDQARDLESLAREKGLMCGVAFQNRLNPAIRALRGAVDEGRFGKIVTATMRLRWCRTQEYYEDGWHGTWAMDGGVINQQAIHHVDALNWLAGPVEAVCAATARRANKLEAEDTLIAAVRFASGALGTIEATTAARPQDFEASISILGDAGFASVGGIALNKVDAWTFVAPKPGDAEVPARDSREVPNGYGLSHGPLLQAVLDALRAGSIVPPVPASEGVKTSDLIHALYRSEEIGGWVKLADRPASERLGLAAAAAARS